MRLEAAGASGAASSSLAGRVQPYFVCSPACRYYRTRISMTTPDLTWSFCVNVYDAFASELLIVDLQHICEERLREAFWRGAAHHSSARFARLRVVWVSNELSMTLSLCWQCQSWHARSAPDSEGPRLPPFQPLNWVVL